MLLLLLVVVQLHNLSSTTTLQPHSAAPGVVAAGQLQQPNPRPL